MLEAIYQVLIAFVVGGLICVVGQILMDKVKLTPAHTMCLFVVLGTILGGFGIYDKFVEFAGAGATTPIISFGNALVQGAILEGDNVGLVGIITGIFEVTSAGISAALIFSFLAALFCRPKG